VDNLQGVFLIVLYRCCLISINNTDTSR